MQIWRPLEFGGPRQPPGRAICKSGPAVGDVVSDDRIMTVAKYAPAQFEVQRKIDEATRKVAELSTFKQRYDPTF